LKGKDIEGPGISALGMDGASSWLCPFGDLKRGDDSYVVREGLKESKYGELSIFASLERLCIVYNKYY